MSRFFGDNDCQKMSAKDAWLHLERLYRRGPAPDGECKISIGEMTTYGLCYAVDIMCCNDVGMINVDTWRVMQKQLSGYKTLRKKYGYFFPLNDDGMNQRANLCKEFADVNT